MANGWGQYAQYLDALVKQKNPQYTPATPATQADMGDVVNAPTVAPQPQPIVPNQPVLRGPAGVAALAKKRVPVAMGRPSTFEQRAPQDDMDALRKLLGGQQADVDKLRGQADTIESTQSKADLSPLMALADAWGNQGGAKFSSLYDKPMKPEERSLMAAKLRNIASDNEQGITKDRIQMLLGGDKNDIQAIKALMLEQQRGLASGSSDSKLLDKRTKDLGNDLNVYNKARTVSGNIAGTNIRFSRLTALLDSLPTLNPTSQEFAELSESLAAALGGSGATSEERVKRLLPDTLKGKVQNIKQWLLNKPTGTDQQEFVKRYVKTINREMELADSQLKELRRRSLSKHQSLWESNPDRVLLQASMWGMKPDEIMDAFRAQDVKDNFTELPRGNKPGGVWDQAVAAQTGKMVKPTKVTQEDWDKLDDKAKAQFIKHLGAQ